MSVNRLRELADSYLDHTLLVLRVDDRGANLRDFLDPWWAYERGERFLRQRRDGTGFSPHTFNNPCPRTHRDRLPYFDWVSDEALLRLKAGSPDKCYVVDHSVPFRTLKRMLFTRREELDQGALRSLLLKLYKRAVITREENERLKVVGLSQQMPDDTDAGDNPYTRYAKACISGSVSALNSQGSGSAAG